MKYYISSNKYRTQEALSISLLLESWGHQPTFDWLEDDNASGEQTSPSLSESRLMAIQAAEMVVFVAPFDSEQYIEYGIALAFNKQVFVHLPPMYTGNMKQNIPYLHHPGVTVVNETLIEFLALFHIDHHST